MRLTLQTSLSCGCDQLSAAVEDRNSHPAVIPAPSLPDPNAPYSGSPLEMLCEISALFNKPLTPLETSGMSRSPWLWVGNM